jgi:hypothetical protein
VAESDQPGRAKEVKQLTARRVSGLDLERLENDTMIVPHARPSYPREAGRRADPMCDTKITDGSGHRPSHTYRTAGLTRRATALATSVEQAHSSARCGRQTSPVKEN